MQPSEVMCLWLQNPDQKMKIFVFLVCHASGATECADILAASPADAVRSLIARFGKVRANIINIY